MARSKGNMATGRIPVRQTGLLEFMVAVRSPPKEESETGGGVGPERLSLELGILGTDTDRFSGLQSPQI